MTIYQPYFYIIQDIRNGMYYAGAKWAKNADPSIFMMENGYTTSSKVINSIITNHGLGSFVIRKLRLFETPEEAYTYESRFLQKVDVRNNNNFYNIHNNNATMVSSDTEMMKILSMEKYGAEHYTQSDDYKKKYNETCMKKYGLPFHTQSESTKRAQIKTNLEKRGVENPSHCPLVRQKISANNKKRKGTDEWKRTEGRALGLRSKELFTGKTIITDGTNNKWFDPENEIIPDGWRLGRAEQIKQKGTMCYTDGTNNRFFQPDAIIPDGWYRGRSRKKK